MKAVAELVHHAGTRHFQRNERTETFVPVGKELLNDGVGFGADDVFDGIVAGVGERVHDVADDLAMRFPNCPELGESEVPAFVEQASGGEGGPPGKSVSFGDQRFLDGVTPVDDDGQPASHADADDVTVGLSHFREGDRGFFTEEGQVTHERETTWSRRQLVSFPVDHRGQLDHYQCRHEDKRCRLHEKKKHWVMGGLDGSTPSIKSLRDYNGKCQLHTSL